jgi:hypothetical protein
MIEIINLIWLTAIFLGILGFQRGWNRELLVTAGLILGMFALFQFDSLLRGTFLAIVPADQVFLVQGALFAFWAFYIYQFRLAETDERGRNANSTNRSDNLQEGILGSLLGFFNGYLIMGGIWYFLDVNEYPFAPFVVAPPSNSPTAQSLWLMPFILFSGGVEGTGDFLTVAVVVCFLLVFFLLL